MPGTRTDRESMECIVTKKHVPEYGLTRYTYHFSDGCHYAQDIYDEVLLEAVDKLDVEQFHQRHVEAMHEYRHSPERLALVEGEWVYVQRVGSVAPHDPNEDIITIGPLPPGEVHPFWMRLAERVEADEVRPIGYEMWNGTEWVPVPDGSEAVVPEPPTSYCFDCGQMGPVADTWTKKSDPNHALCESCFRRAETAGRAKEGRSENKADGNDGCKPAV